jgi:hypothetical protein
MVMYMANTFCAYKYLIQIKLRNSEIWVYNNECSIYVIYYLFVNQTLIWKKSSKDT